MLLGEIAGCKFYIGAAQFEYWRHTQLIIDVVPGRGAGFTLEAPEGVRFLTRSRVFTDEKSRNSKRRDRRRTRRDRVCRVSKRLSRWRGDCAGLRANDGLRPLRRNSN